jgi:hypothetical protein
VSAAAAAFHTLGLVAALPPVASVPWLPVPVSAPVAFLQEQVLAHMLQQVPAAAEQVLVVAEQELAQMLQQVLVAAEQELAQMQLLVLVLAVAEQEPVVVQ